MALGEVKDSAPVPQGFVYLDSFPSLKQALEEKGLEEVIQRVSRPLKLQLIKPENHQSLRRLTTKHISNSYLETGTSYASKLLQIHQDKEDKEGIFSTKKIILEIQYRQKLVGFCVLTEKIGGSIKTGPVLFFEKNQRQGLGVKLRSQLHKIFRSVGYRKAYCTAPVTNASAVKYLLASNYKIEAHLRLQYHTDHNELVFGYALESQRTPPKELSRKLVAASNISLVKSKTDAITGFLQDEFSTHYARMPNQWSARQLNYALKRKKAKSAFKPRQFYVASSNQEPLAAALCLSKRGGSAKVLVVSKTTHADSLLRLVRAAERFASRDARKIYTMVASTDITLQKIFFATGFSAEGILDRPYRPSDDMIVLSKMVRSN